MGGEARNQCDEKPEKNQQGTPKVSDRLARLKQLKAKKAESENKNRKDLFEDHKTQKLRAINKRQIEKLKESAV